MVTKDTFVIGISDRDCRFNEYVYYNESAENGAARLFFEEFRAEYIREQARKEPGGSFFPSGPIFCAQIAARALTTA